jgi:hypothetical protein
MTVTYDISDNVGKVRLKIGDTDTTDYQFTDEEIEVFLSNNSDNINLASAEALEAWASAYATNADSEHIGDYSYSQKIVDRMLALAEKLREQESSSPYMTWGEMDLASIGETVEEDE